MDDADEYGPGGAYESGPNTETPLTEYDVLTLHRLINMWLNPKVDKNNAEIHEWVDELVRRASRLAEAENQLEASRVLRRAALTLLEKEIEKCDRYRDEIERFLAGKSSLALLRAALDPEQKP